MSLSKEQVKHDRINLGRLVKRLENVISNEKWAEGDGENGKQAWVKAEGMAQKIKYARQLLLNVDYYQELDPRTSSPTPSQQRYLQNMRDALDRLDDVVDTVKERLSPEPETQTSYLALVPLPTTVEEIPPPEPQTVKPSPGTRPVPSDALPSERHLSSAPSAPDPAQDLLPSSSTPPPSAPARASSSSQPPAPSSLLSSSLQTHDELSNELARMATQLKRNALHFSESLDKDKSLVQSASEALEKNYDTMTKERVRLRNHSGKSSGTTWMIFGGLAAVSVAWVFMFFIIRLT